MTQLLYKRLIARGHKSITIRPILTNAAQKIETKPLQKKYPTESSSISPTNHKMSQENSSETLTKQYAKYQMKTKKVLKKSKLMLVVKNLASKNLPLATQG